MPGIYLFYYMCLFLLTYSPAAVKVQRLAVDVGVLLGSKEEYRIGNILVLAPVSYRDLLNDGIQIGLRRIVDSHHRTGVDESWGNDIDVDS